jgi:hypothetical protein
MKTKIDMRLDQMIDSAILEIFPLMPSPGSWPFTMMSIERNELTGLKIDKTLFAPFQLLVLKRTDFDSKDLFDYITKSKEYQTVDDKNNFLEKYRKIIATASDFSEWVDRTTSLAIGLVIQTAITKGLLFSPVDTDLLLLDLHLALNQKKLQAYQLFDVNQIDPSFLSSLKK